MRWLWTIAGLWLLWACAPQVEESAPFAQRPQQEIALYSAVEPTELALFDELRVTLDLWVADGREAEFAPQVPSGFRGEVERRPPVELFGGSWQRVLLRLRPTEVGEVELPAFAARDGELVVESDPETLTVRGLLDVAPEEWRDPLVVEAPAELFPQRRPGLGWYLAGIGLALLLIGLGLWWWSCRQAPPSPAELPLPPELLARRALAGLRQARLDDDAAIERFYVEVSQVLRVYLEGRFGLHAPERTTEEFLPEVEQSGWLDGEQRLDLQRFLTQCDLVKFAAVRPGAEVHQRTLAVAEAMIDNTAEDRSEPQGEVA